MKFVKTALILLSALALLTACVSKIEGPVVSETSEPPADLPPVQEPYPVSFDNETFDAAPTSVVSISPALTEIICEVGGADRVVGISEYCDWPAQTETLPARVGSPANPDLSAIKALGPELLVTQSPLASTDVLSLEQSGVRVLTFDMPKTYAELTDQYMKLAMIFNGVTDYRAAAQSALSALDSEMNRALSLGVSVSFVIVEAESGDGLMLSNGGTLCSDILSVYGENLFGGEKGYYSSPEVLYILAPDVVFMADGVDRDVVREHFPHADIIKIDLARFESPTARISEVVAGCTSELG